MTARSIPSLERELRDRDRTIHKLRKELRELERERFDRDQAWRCLPAIYAEAFLDLHHVAHYGIGGDQAGVDPNGPGSRPPIHHSVAYHRFGRELADLEKRAGRISTALGGMGLPSFEDRKAC